MDRKVKSFRLRVDLLSWLESYATGRNSSQIAVLEQALEDFRALAQGGVPDLPATEDEETVAKMQERSAMRAAALVTATRTSPPAGRPGLTKAQRELARSMGWGS